MPILVVDDDPETLRHLRDTLAEAGYAPLVTGDPGAVARIIRAEKPRLVLLDLMLPGTDGIELMQTVPELSDLPVIFISGYGRDETIARALETCAYCVRESVSVAQYSPPWAHSADRSIPAVVARRRAIPTAASPTSPRHPSATPSITPAAIPARNVAMNVLVSHIQPCPVVDRSEVHLPHIRFLSVRSRLCFRASFRRHLAVTALAPR